MVKRCLLLVSFLFLAPVAAHAQTGALTAINWQFYQNGAILPAQVLTIPLPSGATCGQPLLGAPPPITYITTSARLTWIDPADVTKLCIAVQAAGGVLLSLPLGANYTATATFTNDFNNTGPASNVSNSFTRGASPLPPAPTGATVRQ